MPLESDLQDGQRWTFDADVTDAFDDMLERSIPSYELMRRWVTAAAVAHLPRLGDLADLGCSHGETIARIRAERPDVRAVGCEVSAPMLEAARARFDGDPVTIVDLDLRRAFPRPHRPDAFDVVGGDVAGFDVVTSVLALMFVPIEYRPQILERIAENLKPGGALVLVEKVLGGTGWANEFLTDVYHGLKREHGYSDDEIVRKAAALEGVLVPVTARANEEMLRDAGFAAECVWRWGPFMAWVARPR